MLDDHGRHRHRLAQQGADITFMDRGTPEVAAQTRVEVSARPIRQTTSSSKAGLIGLTKAVAREVASRGITANAVAPGFIITELTKDLPEELQEAIRKQTPLGQFGTVDDIANAVAFLASDEAGYITGQVLAVDGGLVMM